METDMFPVVWQNVWRAGFARAPKTAAWLAALLLFVLPILAGCTTFGGPVVIVSSFDP